jgi:hypothetical protein
MMRPLLMIALACLALGGCETKTEDGSDGKPSADAKSAKAPASASPGAKPTTAAASAAPSTAPASSPPDGALTVADLAGALEANIDKTVKLSAQFLNANSVKVDGKMTVQNIVLVAGRDKTKPSVACVLVDDSKPQVEGMKQYTELLVEGKVRKSAFGDPQLVDCKIITP